MNQQSQRGMVLLISLVMLLLLTIIAITAANQSNLQVRMAANSQQQNNAFQAAESGLQKWVADFKLAPLAFDIPAVTWYAGAGHSRYEATADTANSCAGVIPAFSLNADEGSNSFQYACYEIRSTGQSCSDANCNASDNPAKAIHVLGYLEPY